MVSGADSMGHAWRRPTRLAAALLYLGSMGCGGPKCSNEAFYGLPSPDGGAIAFVFHRRCEAARTRTDVSVMEYHGKLQNTPGNVLSVGEEQPVRVSWLGPNTLLVTGFKDPVLLRNQHVGSFSIEFRQAAAGGAAVAR